jgi:hypothetical protein
MAGIGDVFGLAQECAGEWVPRAHGGRRTDHRSLSYAITSVVDLVLMNGSKVI